MSKKKSRYLTDRRPKAYDRFLAPMEIAWFARWRKSMLTNLEGEVLDIGSGTGTNLLYYPEGVDCVTVVDPNRDNISYLTRKAEGWGYGMPGGRCLKTHLGRGENLPFPAGSFDHVVSTLILCTVEEPEKVVSEGIRVLNSGGEFILIEHQLPGLQPQAAIFNLISPLWHAPSGCNLNRRTERMMDGMDGLEKISSFKGGPFLGYPFYIARYRKK